MYEAPAGAPLDYDREQRFAERRRGREGAISPAPSEPAPSAGQHFGARGYSQGYSSQVQASAPRGMAPRGSGSGPTGAPGVRRDRFPSAGSGGQCSLYELEDDGDQQSWTQDARGRGVAVEAPQSKQNRKSTTTHASRVNRAAQQAAHRRLSEPANEDDDPDPDGDRLSTSEMSAASANDPAAAQPAKIRSRFPHSDSALF